MQVDDRGESIDYQAMAEFRYQIRRFLHFSEETAKSAGIEPQQYQLLLALKGLPTGRKATIRELAERLQVQHHSTVELIDRLEERGLVRRRRDEQDQRQVLLSLTTEGEAMLKQLALRHRTELRQVAPALVMALRALDDAHEGIEKPEAAGLQSNEEGNSDTER